MMELSKGNPPKRYPVRRGPLLAAPFPVPACTIHYRNQIAIPLRAVPTSVATFFLESASPRNLYFRTP